MRKKSALPRIAQRNIEEIAKVEQALLNRRPPLERLGDVVAHFFGSVWFIAAQAIVIGAWIEWNLPWQNVHDRFDPYPFPLLSLVVDVEFLLLTTFVLMNQKHQSRRNEHWAHLHLQLSMLTEQEVTKNLQLLDAIAKHLGVVGVGKDSQLAEMARPTPVAEFVGEIEKSREPAVGDATPAIADVRAIATEGVTSES